MKEFVVFGYTQDIGSVELHSVQFLQMAANVEEALSMRQERERVGSPGSVFFAASAYPSSNPSDSLHSERYYIANGPDFRDKPYYHAAQGPSA